MPFQGGLNDGVVYPLNEFRKDYTITDIVKMLKRHKNKRITDRLIENIQYEMKT